MRDRIISEIKRLSAENGGKAPGMALFERDTGIKVSEWRGKFWVKWSDALDDAGLVVNELTPKSTDEEVLDEYEKACRQFERPPTDPELRMLKKQDQISISGNTMIRHFGNKAGVIAALRDRAIERGENELVAILPEVNAPLSSKASPDSAKVSEGWVYLLQSGDYFKIGRSDELEKRVKQISISLPEKVELVHAIKTDDPPGIEAYWHRRFADQRANGEWFKLSATHVKAFKRRKYQ